MKPFILADKRIPETAKQNLADYGKLLFLDTSGIVYPQISGHPDIFFCKGENELIYAPDVPVELVEKLSTANIRLVKGESKLGSSYPETASYNAVICNKRIIHNRTITDQKIDRLYPGFQKLDVNQAYTRCNLLPLTNDKFITSDKGIENSLMKSGFEVLYVNPEKIVLPGFDHGFFGGACGIHKNRVFIIGNLDHFPDGKAVRKFLRQHEIIELYDGPLFDGGSLIFV